MIDFIVCDDSFEIRQMVNDIITKYMMKNQIHYKIHMFEDYDNNFIKIVKKNMSFKIYILDIEVPSRSGIDVARIIRNNDVNSIIIFLTGHQELSSVVAEKDFLFLTFINKFNNCEERLYSSIDKAIKFLNYKKTIEFKDAGIIYTINIDDILYVLRDSVERKCLLYTDYSVFKIGKSLQEIRNMLTDNFIQTHRACLVNKKRIACYDKNNRIIIFDNGVSMNVVSTRFKWEGK